MDFFHYKNGVLHCEDVDMAALATKYATPTYVYSASTLTRHCRVLLEAFDGYPSLVCFAVKANSNLSYLKHVVSLGLGADVVSGGEIERALLAGCPPERIIYSGVGKQEWEIRRALEVGIQSFNVESLFELEDIERVAASLGKKASVSLRLNPNIDAKTNPKISTGLYSTKFGIPESDLPEVLASLKSSPNLSLRGLACHIGSQIVSLQPLVEAAQRLTTIAREVQDQGFALEFLDVGGGLGICYEDEQPPALKDYAEALMNVIKPTGLKLVIEPGRVIAGNTGVLLTKVIGIKYQKQKRFVIVDAAMNDLMRPTLYDAFHAIAPYDENKPVENTETDIVGPICETGDILAKNRQNLPSLEKGDLIAIRTVGAYGAGMSSHYNSRPRSAEVMVSADQVTLIRKRESLEDMWKMELDV